MAYHAVHMFHCTLCLCWYCCFHFYFS